ncbi:SDR family oxidoreductase [Subtercola lobariae]|uniref:Nucleoside-diphosphate sugar epimerase n=1 Tax=Subtercola lobariae TaxID=1588641 RepID=A0A917EUY7_9MICO|nr:SDR family oxidoreductase [Subtercola lobariae]GGF15630.1 nucleoside-diphosphate sugar epimerase [Subtercola lobariae]
MKIAVAGGTGVVGHYVVEGAERRGHDVITLSRAAGVDLMTGSAPSLAGALQGVDVAIDVSSVQTQSAKKSEHFFGTVTERMFAAEKVAGVGHHIALSIVGSDNAPYGYYAGKALQERIVIEGSIPWTILRATQFHEFASQIFGQAKLGPIHVVPKMISQPIAAWEVANRLVELAENAPAGRATDLAGPEVLRMVDMVTAYVAATHARGTILEVPLPGGFGTALRNRTLLPDSSAQLGTQTYAEWLTLL